MSTLQVFPPNAENEELFAQIPGLRQTPIPVIGFDGPDGHLARRRRAQYWCCT